MRDLIRVLDFETTDDAPEMEPIELGWTDLYLDGRVGLPNNILIAPTRPISPGAMAVHHITEAEAATGVKDRSWVDAMFSPPPGDTIVAFAAHNHSTEKTIIDGLGDPRSQDINWICTYKTATIAYPHAPKHTNQVLRYWIDGGLKLDQKLGLPAHRAGPDSYVSAFICQALLQQMNLQRLLDITKYPVLRRHIWFSKHKGKPWSEIDMGFFDWMRRQQDMSADALYCVGEEIKRRAKRPSDFDRLVGDADVIIPLNAPTDTGAGAVPQVAGADVTWNSAPLSVSAAQPTPPAQPELPAAPPPPESPAFVPLYLGFRRRFIPPALAASSPQPVSDQDNQAVPSA